MINIEGEGGIVEWRVEDLGSVCRLLLVFLYYCVWAFGYEDDDV